MSLMISSTKEVSYSKSLVIFIIVYVYDNCTYICSLFPNEVGNGEAFYGKRKYKPSGSVETDYNGYGFSDSRKIDAAREFRAERERIRDLKAAEKKN